MTRAEYLLDLYEAHYKFKDIKKHKVPLEPEERAEVFKRKAVWHFNGGGPSSAIWKANMPDGKTIYGCNTHRAMQYRPTLKGALAKWPFIKSTA